MSEQSSISGVPATSHGRGGAGNIGKERRSSPAADDLKTPVIKSQKYTTGRGGTGNMARNDPEHPEIARASQDVDGPQPRDGTEPMHHVGRGGSGNVVTGEKDATKFTDPLKKE